MIFRWIFFLFITAGVAAAEGIISLASDNDAYFPPSDYDRFYTAGTRLAWAGPWLEGSALGSVGLLHFLLPPSSRPSLELGQEIRTPNDKNASHFIPSDMPYSGYLYLRLGTANSAGNFLEKTALDLGLVGPWTGAKQIQDLIHEALHCEKLKGWKNQLSNEPVINLYYSAAYKIKLIPNSLELIPRAGLALGTALTHADLALEARLGWGLDEDFGEGVVLGDGLRLYAWGELVQCFVGRNIFLQGNSFGGVKTSLKIERSVQMLRAGIVLGWKKYSLAFSHTMRTREFAGQSQVLRYGTSQYASIRLELAF